MGKLYFLAYRLPRGAALRFALLCDELPLLAACSPSRGGPPLLRVDPKRTATTVRFRAFIFPRASEDAGSGDHSVLIT
jgi:hypothetical protein